MNDDTKRLNWLQGDDSRLQDVYYRVQNEGCSIREAIDWMMKHQREGEGELQEA